MHQLWPIRLPPAFRNHLPMTQHHEAVQLHLLLFDGIQKIQDRLSGNALRFWRAARKL